MLGLDFAVGLLFLLGFFQRLELVFGQDQIILSHLGFQGFESFLKRLQIVAQPDAAHAARRDENPCFLELIGDPQLAIGRLGKGKIDDRLFDLGINPVFDQRLLPAHILQSQLAALVI